MTLEEFRDFCLSFPGTSEHTPFDEVTLVFKVGNKMFALANMDIFQSFNVKCNPERAIDLREQYSEVLPGYHMSKVHWNTVSVTGSLSDKMLKSFIEDSYHLVRSSLTKKEQATL